MFLRKNSEFDFSFPYLVRDKCNIWCILWQTKLFRVAEKANGCLSNYSFITVVVGDVAGWQNQQQI
jgi:hypothetical protein